MLCCKGQNASQALFCVPNQHHHPIPPPNQWTSSAIHDAYYPVCLENQKYQDDGIKPKKAKKRSGFRTQETRNLLVRVSG